MNKNRFRFEPPEQMYPESYYYMPPRRRQLELDDIIESKKFWEGIEKDFKDKNKPKPAIDIFWWKVALFCAWPFVVLSYAAVVIASVKFLATSIGVK